MSPASVPAGGPSPAEAELAAERTYVAGLYARLDELRLATRRQLQATWRSREGRTPAAQTERDAFAAGYERRLSQLEAVDDGLCFGRLDRANQQWHIGRLGLADENQQRLLVDWRAPAAEPFYRATAAHPDGVIRRRHLRTRQREVLGLDDEVFDLDALPETDRRALSGEAALMRALQEQRSGRMHEVVATLQAEQDEVVRADAGGVLVVQGGPGTGKTVVALHRAAYLLYTHRDRLATAGVLVVGPGAVFLRYVEQVLPSLGETAVVLASLAELFPGVRATGQESPETAGIKGESGMLAALAAALANRQRLPAQDLTLRFEGHRLRLDVRSCREARDRARRSGQPHNPARNSFLRQLLNHLARQVVGRDAWSELDRRERDELLRELIRTPAIRSTLDGLWPHLTPQQLVSELLSDPAQLAAAGLPRQLLRPADAPWTPADVPLLDEAAELIGETNPWRAVAARRAQAAASRELRYAEDALRASGAGGGLVDAATLARRYAGGAGGRDLAEVALGDREWVYGHVVVDEAQELSFLAWRLLMRRCPSRSMTVVGDLAQASAARAPRSWEQALDEHAPGRWRVAELTVGYRTPAPVMALAADVLAELAPDLAPPRAVRTGTAAPQARRVAELTAGVVQVVGELLAAQAGRIAVIGPAAPALLAALAERFSGVGQDTDALVAVLDVPACKGLEFDAVVVAEPAAVIAAGPRGLGDLYVAVTRTTDRLTVVHTTDLPPVLRRLG